MVVSSAVGCQLGSDKSGYRIVNVKNDQITHQYYSVEWATNEYELIEYTLT